MKKVLFVSTMIFLLAGIGMAFAQDDIKRFPSCFYCGMDRAKFAHSRMHLEYEDGSTLGTCSIRCTAVDMAFFIDKPPVAMQVGDYNTRKLVDAEKAYWVIGGKKMGVMTKRAKWAFAKKGDAEKFIKANGGKMATFEEAIQGAEKEATITNELGMHARSAAMIANALEAAAAKDLTVHVASHALVHYFMDQKALPLWLREGIAFVGQDRRQRLRS